MIDLTYGATRSDLFAANRNVLYRLNMTDAEGWSASVVVEAVDREPSFLFLSEMSRGRFSEVPGPLDRYPDALQHFSMLVAGADLDAGGRGIEIGPTLKSPEVVVPVFGSPPQGWKTLAAIMSAGASARFSGATDVPMLLLLGAGWTGLIYVVTPVLEAVGEGLAGKIRAAFGVPERIEILQNDDELRLDRDDSD
ncbi:hypothetical protein [Streptomyces sp. NPDC060187]|uniref:hypothetical protein n=1 Tax=Streptomyces sp. NPDC060187 TaxID=3347067 RepID=UPI0036653242